jgi:hypothetical protein
MAGTQKISPFIRNRRRDGGSRERTVAQRSDPLLGVAKQFEGEYEKEHEHDTVVSRTSRE